MQQPPSQVDMLKQACGWYHTRIENHERLLAALSKFEVVMGASHGAGDASSTALADLEAVLGAPLTALLRAYARWLYADLSQTATENHLQLTAIEAQLSAARSGIVIPTLERRSM